MKFNSGQFKKGQVSWNKGNHPTEETRKKISEHHANVKGKNNPMYGKKRPQYVRDAISRVNLGRGLTKEHREKLS